MITLFGTCRLDLISNHNNLNNLLNYTHSTKEVIQLIKYIKGELEIPEPYDILCFRTAICNNNPIEYNQVYANLFEESKIILVEICSNKKYIHNNYYLHHLCVDKRHQEYNINTPEEILQGHLVEKQTDEEIEKDLLEIKQMLYPKRMILITHYNSKKDGEYIPARNHLILLLETLCSKHNIPYINPLNALQKYSQDSVMSDDLGHYTPFGREKFTEYVNGCILEFKRRHQL